MYAVCARILGFLYTLLPTTRMSLHTYTLTLLYFLCFR